MTTIEETLRGNAISHINHAFMHSQPDEHINIEEQTVSFSIQCGPVKDCGKNGCDATEILKFLINLYKSFNAAFSSRENAITITKLEEALHWQEARTRDRVARGVEGKNHD